MKVDRWQTVEKLFYQALDVPAPERLAWLEKNCGGDATLLREILSLLESDEAVSAEFLHGKIGDALAGFGAVTQGVPPRRQRVGPYRLLRIIGNGGMGAVYEAERDDRQYTKKVAVKLVRAGMDTEFILARFRRERQILAHLEHPNVARLLDGGTADDGTPYIVMEYIDGLPVTAYCERNKLPVEARLEIFLQVCAAVDYAHRRFVVHRDLKPGNILVDQSGTPKLLDFGISKLLMLDGQTAGQTVTEGGRLMTPDYASPEQILGDPVTIVSDVYSLGVILYELLTGQRPYRIERLSFQAIEKAICHDEIKAPSTAVHRDGDSAHRALSRRLAGDLDTIVLRALQKDARRRYQSAEELAEDIRRHLIYLPISARPDTLLYRTTKFARRNRGILAAGLAVLLALGTGIVAARREAATAKRHFEQARRLANTFVFDVHDSVRDLPGSTRARQRILQTGLQYLDALSQDSSADPELQAELAAAYLRIADVQGNVLGPNLGHMTSAERNYRKAIELYELALAKAGGNRESHIGRLNAEAKLGDLYSYTRSPSRAIESYRQALEDAESLLRRFPNDPEVLRLQAGLLNKASREHRHIDDYEASSDFAGRAVSIIEELLRASPGDSELLSQLSTTYANLGMAQSRTGKLQPALENHHRGTPVLEKLTDSDPANTNHLRNLMLAYSHAGDVLGSPTLSNLGDTAGARDAYARMAGIARRLYDSDPANQRWGSDYANALMRQAAVEPPARRLELQLLAHQRLADVVRAAPENLLDRGTLAFLEGQIGETLAALGREGESLRYLRDAERNARVVLAVSPDNPTVQRSLFGIIQSLGKSLARSGDTIGAINYAQECLDLGRRLSERNTRGTRVARYSYLARSLAGAGSIHSVLARQTSVPASDRERHTAEARGLLEKGAALWSDLEREPDFTPVLRRYMQETSTLLTALPPPQFAEKRP
jgi:eukaryotic-like serine/threonine-protein kinase